MPKTKKEKLLRSKDVAHLLDCSPDDVIELARKGKLRAEKLGRFWRFKYTDVMFYKKRTVLVWFFIFLLLFSKRVQPGKIFNFPGFFIIFKLDKLNIIW